MEINSPASSSPPRSATSSPPPKCAICLGTFTNKCYSNSCMHQFCFKCLLEWSKVKPECPLCKQSFKSIIHNIKSNDEYDEHIVEPPPPLGVPNIGNGEFLYNMPQTPSRHFQFRTTFTVDPRGEFAIQQLLLSHPLTNTMYNMHAGNYMPRHSNGRFRLRQPRRASSATSFRRSVYDLGLWVRNLAENNGRTRDINPNFFRENPTARHRLAPWLNRELNALLRENTQQVMTLVDIIMDHLTRWHIRSRSFKILLQPHLDANTDHFIHEFSNFMKSPSDMIAYDRLIVYTERPTSPTLFIVSDQEDDSDVAIVNISDPIIGSNNPFQSPTIEVIEINSDSSRDSDIMIGDNPEPEIVNLIDSDTNDPSPRVDSHRHSSSEENRKPILPLKVRLKRKHQPRESRYQNRQCCTKIQENLSRSRSPITTTSTSSSSSDSSDASIPSEPHKYKRKYKYKYKKSKTRNTKPRKINKKPTRYTEQSDDDSSSTSESNSDCEDVLPPRKLRRRKVPETNRSFQTLPSKTHTVTTKNLQSFNMEAGPSTQEMDSNEVTPSCSLWDTSAGFDHRIDTSPHCCSNTSTLIDANGRLSELERNLSFDDYLFPEYSTVGTNGSELYNNSQQYESALPTFSPYNSPRVGPRYYDCDYSIRGEMFPVMHSSNYANENVDGFVQPKVEVPSRVTVTPQETEMASSSYFTHSDSHNKRLQSVIVKKEDYLLSDSSDN